MNNLPKVVTQLCRGKRILWNAAPVPVTLERVYVYMYVRLYLCSYVYMYVCCADNETAASQMDTDDADKSKVFTLTTKCSYTDHCCSDHSTLYLSDAEH